MLHQFSHYYWQLLLSFLLSLLLLHCRLSSNGLFLLENGHDLFMWVGRAVNPAIINTLFGVNTLEGADMASLQINPANSDFSSRVDAVVQALRQDRARYVVFVVLCCVLSLLC